MTRLIPWICFVSWFLFACQTDNKEKNPQHPLPLNIDTVTGAPVGLPNPWKNAGCALVTDEEVIRLFNVDPKRDALNTRTLPDQGFCLRSWYRPDWKERESNNEKPGATYQEFKNMLVTQILDYGTEVTSRQQFDMVRRDQRDTYEEEVSGLGEGALWSTSTTSLMVKKGHLVVKITLDHQDAPHDNLPMAKEVAKLALRKML